MFRVSAINLQQVKVVFSRAVDSTTAQTLANYNVDSAVPGGIAAAVLQGDKKTVIITLNAPYAQGTTKNVKVLDQVIQEKTTGYGVPGYNKDVTFSDVTAPKVSSVSVSGNKSVSVTFSEAIGATNAASAANYKLDGQSLSAFGGSVAITNGYVTDNSLTNKVTITFDSALSAGTHTLTVGASSTAPLADTASFTMLKNDQSFNVDSVTTAPTITSITGNINGKVTVVFSQEMKESTLASSFTVGTTTVTGTLNSKDSSGKTVDLDFGASVVKEGANVLEIVKNQVADVYGNVFAPSANARVSFTASKDAVAPTVDSAYAVSETTIRVNFSELIDPVYRAQSNFILKDAAGNTKFGGSGTAWSSITAGADNSVVNLNLTAAQAEALGKATYTLVIKNVADLAGNIMTETTKSIATIDNTAPSLASGSNLLVNTATRTVQVFFNEPMDAATIGTLSNYYYDAASNGAFTTLPSSTTVSVAANAKSVTFTFPATENVAGWAATVNIRVIGVKDAAGNSLKDGAQTTADWAAASSANNPKVVADSLKIYSDSNKVWATFDTDQVLDSVSKADFNAVVTTATGIVVIKDAAAGAGEVAYTPDSATRVNKTVTLTWSSSANAKTALKAAGKSISMAASSSYDATLNADGAMLLVGSSAVRVVDSILPVLVSNSITLSTSSTITVSFNEALKDQPALYGDDFIVIVGGEVVSSSKVTATLDASKKVITLTLTGYTITDPTTVIVKAKATGDLADAAGNLYVPTSDDIAGYKPAAV